jgi:hypothetical protein
MSQPAQEKQQPAGTVASVAIHVVAPRLAPVVIAACPSDAVTMEDFAAPITIRGSFIPSADTAAGAAAAASSAALASSGAAAAAVVTVAMRLVTVPRHGTLQYGGKHLSAGDLVPVRVGSAACNRGNSTVTAESGGGGGGGGSGGGGGGGGGGVLNTHTGVTLNSKP